MAPHQLFETHLDSFFDLKCNTVLESEPSSLTRSAPVRNRYLSFHLA